MMSRSQSGADSVIILRTERQLLRTFTRADAHWLLEALNEPSFIQQIGDRQVRTVDQAQQYLEQNLLAHYRQHGHGMWLCERLEDQQRLGMCGLLRREYLDAPDIGYAYRPEFWGRGYAIEAARATAAIAAKLTGSTSLIGITSTGNEASIQVLIQLGMQESVDVPMAAGSGSRMFQMDLP